MQHYRSTSSDEDGYNSASNSKRFSTATLRTGYNVPYSSNTNVTQSSYGLPISRSQTPSTANQSFRKSSSSFMLDSDHDESPSLTHSSYSESTSPDVDSSSNSFYTAPSSRSQTPFLYEPGQSSSRRRLISSSSGATNGHEAGASVLSPVNSSRQTTQNKTASIQSIPWDEDGSFSGRVTPTAFSTFYDNAAVASNGTDTNGLRVSIDRSLMGSRRGTMEAFSNASDYKNPSASHSRQSSFVSHKSLDSRPYRTVNPSLQSEMPSSARPNFLSAHNYQSEESSIDSHESNPTPTPASRTLSNSRNPLSFPGVPSPVPLQQNTNGYSSNWQDKQRRRESSLYGDIERRWSLSQPDDAYGGYTEQSPPKKHSVPHLQEAEEEDDNHVLLYRSIPAPPLLKLDLDFGSSSLLSDLGLDMGLGFDSSTFGSSLRSSSSSSHSQKTPTESSLSSSNFFTSTSTEANLRLPEATSPVLPYYARPLSSTSISSVSTVKFDQEGNHAELEEDYAESKLPASIALPLSRPMSVFSMLDSVSSEQSMLSPQMDGRPALPFGYIGSASHSRQISDGSDSSSGRSEPQSANQSSGSRSANCMFIFFGFSLRKVLPTVAADDLGIKPVKPLSYKRRGSLSSNASQAHRNRSNSAVSFVEQPATFKNWQSSQPKPPIAEHPFPLESDLRGRSVSDSSASDINKSLPPTPIVGKRSMNGSRPSFPEHRSGSLRKTSAGAQAVAANLMNKGRNLMIRTASHREPKSQDQSPTLDTDSSVFSKPPHSRTSISSLFHRSAEQERKSSQSQRSEDSRSSVEDTGIDHKARIPNQGNMRPALAMKKSFDMLKSKISSSSHATEMPDDLSKVTIQREPQVVQLKEVNMPAPADATEAERRPSTDMLLVCYVASLPKS